LSGITRMARRSRSSTPPTTTTYARTPTPLHHHHYAPLQVSRTLRLHLLPYAHAPPLPPLPRLHFHCYLPSAPACLCVLPLLYVSRTRSCLCLARCLPYAPASHRCCVLHLPRSGCRTRFTCTGLPHCRLSRCGLRGMVIKRLERATALPRTLVYCLHCTLHTPFFSFGWLLGTLAPLPRKGCTHYTSSHCTCLPHATFFTCTPHTTQNRKRCLLQKKNARARNQPGAQACSKRSTLPVRCTAQHCL